MANSKPKYEKKLKCSNLNIGSNAAIITFVEEQEVKQAAPVTRSGVAVTLYDTNIKDGLAYVPGQIYTVTIQ